MFTPCVCVFILSIYHANKAHIELDRTELKSRLLLMLNNKNSTQKHSVVSSSSKTTSADGPVLPVCSHSTYDDGTKISALSTPEIEVHKGGKVKCVRVQEWMTQPTFCVSIYVSGLPHQGAIFHTKMK